MQLDSKFKHHSRCKALPLTNIAFADDVFMFSRGNTRSVDSVASVFFINWTGGNSQKVQDLLWWSGC